MKKPIVFLILIAVLCAVFSGCNQEISAPSEATAEPTAAVDQPTTAPTSAPETQILSTAPDTEAPSDDPALVIAEIDPNTTYEYEVREIWVDNNGQKIYGEAYIPITEGRVPLVIHSHGMGTNHEAGASYGKKYAPRGIALYTFDFRGGSNSNNENRSDGSTTEMSVLTEADDVTAILSAAKTWDFVDPNRIFLEGGSQGGLVTAIAGVQHQSEIAGLILHYPAFGMHDIMNDGRSIEDIPETMNLGGLLVGRVFIQDLWSYDVRDDLPSFYKPVLIIQGSDDNLVRPSVTYAAFELYPNAEYRVIEGAGHGFSGAEHDEATEYGLDFIYRMIGVRQG